MIIRLMTRIKVSHFHTLMTFLAFLPLSMNEILLIFFFSTGKHREIERAYYSGILDPSADWHSLTFEGANAQITYRVRVQCDPRYYSATCTKFCRPYNDTFGHYTCDQEGEKVCDPGWNGTNCEVRKWLSFISIRKKNETKDERSEYFPINGPTAKEALKCCSASDRKNEPQHDIPPVKRERLQSSDPLVKTRRGEKSFFFF